MSSRSASVAVYINQQLLQQSKQLQSFKIHEEYNGSASILPRIDSGEKELVIAGIVLRKFHNPT
jgi:hypothetical protein